MNKIVLSFLALLCCINIQAGVKLQKQGSATQLVVNDKPMLLLAGELSNSAATSPADIRKALKQMKNSGVNSVFVPAYWEFVEPDEGKYDFALVDSVITTARKHDLKIVFLWFGAWKNSMSRSEEHTSELQSHSDLVCRLLLEKKLVYLQQLARQHRE